MKKSDVLGWLDEQHHSRRWLADQCQVSKRTVDNWLVSTRPIPAKAVPIINDLMQQDEERERFLSLLPQQLVLHFSDEEFALVCDAALAEGKRVKDWAEEKLNTLAKTDDG